MPDISRFNVEIINTNGGEFDRIKAYCASHDCGEKTLFHDRYTPCQSHREGKCMMLEFMKEVAVSDN